MSGYTYKTLHRLSNVKDLTILLYTIFCKKEDWHQRVLVLEIENNITKIPVFAKLECEFEITIT